MAAAKATLAAADANSLSAIGDYLGQKVDQFSPELRGRHLAFGLMVSLLPIIAILPLAVPLLVLYAASLLYRKCVPHNN